LLTKLLEPAINFKVRVDKVEVKLEVKLELTWR
jgi:hypothetical protein